MAVLPTYQYLPLKPASQADGEFRILTLYPGERGSDIKTTLRHVLFNQPPLYETLSYTWGNPKGPRNKIPAEGNPTEVFKIQLNGQPKYITYNLRKALEQLRHETKPTVMWIDALCIDQENKIEQSEQVKAMAKIYSQASRVIVWLGEKDTYVDTAFNALEELFWATKIRIMQYTAQKLNVPWFTVSSDTLASLINVEQRSGTVASTPFRLLTSYDDICILQRALSMIPMNFSMSTDPMELTMAEFRDSRTLAYYLVSDRGKLSEFPGLSNIAEAFTEVFISRSYWTRIWTVQEVLNAASAVVVCGDRSVNLDMVILLNLALSQSFPAAASHLFDNVDTLSATKLGNALSYLWSFETDCRSNKDPRRRMKLSYNIVIYSNRACSDPRDKIYSLVNISQPANIIIDYRKSVIDTLIDTTRSIIIQERSLNFICAQDKTLPSNEDEPTVPLPSWVPPIGRHPFVTRIIYDLKFSNNQQQAYRGGGSLPAQDGILIGNPAVLPIRGRFSGDIVTVWAQLFPRSWLNYHNILVSLQEHLCTSATQSRELWHALVLDRYRDSSNVRCRLGSSAEAEANIMADIEHSVARNEPPPARLAERFDQALSQKWLCRTSDGRIALVHGEVRIGDRVFFARGATCPFILRPPEENRQYEDLEEGLRINKYFRFMSYAYVHNRMDGEPFQEIENGEVEEEAVYLV